MSFESTRWTSNTPHPFAPAPGAGVGEMLDRRQRKPATVNFESGFAAEAFGAEYTLPDQIVKAKGPFIVKRKPVGLGETPAALIQIYFTDRGTINQAQLDQNIFGAIKQRGFIMSAGTKFESLPVSWAWRKMPAADKYTKDLYFPVVVTPKYLDGMVYSGSAVSSAELMDANFSPTAAVLAKLPKQLWVYTFAVTNPQKQFTDADGAQVLTLLKKSWSVVLPYAGASAYGYVTLLGAKPDVFGNGVVPVPTPTPVPTPDPTPEAKKNWWWLLAAAAAVYSQMG